MQTEKEGVGRRGGGTREVMVRISEMRERKRI